MGIFKKSEDKPQAEAIEELRQRIISARLPSPVHEVVNNELELLSKIGPATAEYTIGLTYMDVAVTGELTLTGRLLPVGGIKEKLLAAKHSGVRVVILPFDNKVDNS